MKKFLTNSRKTTAAALKLIGLVLVTGSILYAMQWAQLAYELAHICDKYPAMFADCRE